MRNLLFVALLATAALSMGCNGIHKRGGCHGGACGGHAGGCPSGACGGHGGGYAHAGCEACGDGRFAGGGGHGGHGGGGHFGNGHGGGPGNHQRGMPGVPHHFSREYLGPQGPPSAQVAYPYYTTRGPRDYFANEPMSIGP